MDDIVLLMVVAIMRHQKEHVYCTIQGHSQDFLKGVSKNIIGLPEQGSGGAAPSH